MAKPKRKSKPRPKVDQEVTKALEIINSELRRLEEEQKTWLRIRSRSWDESEEEPIALTA